MRKTFPKQVLAAAIIACLAISLYAKSEKPAGSVPQWFKDAKFGIFVHWGIYAVDGTGASWGIFNKSIPYGKYMSQADRFDPKKYDPAKWAELFKEAGAKYAVLTTKHHDGMALWDTQQLTNGEKLSVVTKTPIGRDLVGPFVKAMRDAGFNVGLYYSWLDWSNKDYAAKGRWRRGEAPPENTTPENEDKWKRFLAFIDGQLKELCDNYKPDLIWFDGYWDVSPKDWKMADFKKKLKSWDPGVVLNSRMGGYGDYDTPEQGIPVVPPKKYWELCMTMNRTWGYNKFDTKHKSAFQLIRILMECVSMGGNLLLNVGPTPDGTIRPEQVAILKKIGVWTHKYAEAIYGTIPGPARIHYGFPSTLSKDRKTLYLCVFNSPVNQILFKGLINKPKKITLMATGEELKRERVGGAPWMHIPGVLFITLPKGLEVGYGTVVKIEMDEPIKLYTGKPGAIEQN